MVLRWLVPLLLLSLQDDPSALIERLRSNSISEREDAFRRLKLLEKKAMPALELAQSDSDPEVAGRVRQLIALQRVREQLSPLALAIAPEAPELMSRSDPSGATVLFLKLAKDPRAPRGDLALLAPKALGGARTSHEQLEIVPTLTHLRIRTAAKELVGILNQPDEYVAYHVKEALSTMECVDQIPSLVRATREGPPGTRRHAAALLGVLGASDQIPALISLLEDPDPEVRDSAAEALVQLDAKGTAPELLRLARNPVAAHAALQVLQQLGIPESLPLFRKALRQGTPEERVQAAAAMKTFGVQDSAADLLAALSHSDQNVIGAAAYSLATLRCTEAFDPILRAFKAQPETFGTLPRSLVMLDDARAGSELCGFLTSDKQVIRETVRSALRELAPFEPRPELLRLLLHSDAEVRKIAKELTSHLVPSDAEPLLLELLSSDNQDMVLHAVTLIGRVGSGKAVPPIRALIGKSREEIQCAAIRSLGSIAAPEAVQDLQPLLTDKNARIRESARWTLFALGARDVLLRHLREDPPLETEDRSQRASLWYQLDRSAALPEIVKGLDDPSPDVKCRCAYMLGESPPEFAGPKIAALLQDPDPRTRVVALFALRKVPFRGALTDLRRFVEKGTGQEPQAALAALAAVAEPGDLPEWLGRLSSPDADVRDVAAEAFARAAGPKDLESILELLKSSDPETRLGALLVFKLKSLPGAEAEIARLLKDPLPSVRMQAIWTLSARELKTSREALLRSCRDPVPEVRTAAVNALIRHWTPAVVPILKERLQDSDQWNRQVAAEALCAHGDATGVPVALVGRELWVLNALRKPRAWNRLSEQSLPPTRETLQDLLEGLDGAGMKVEWGKSAHSSFWRGRYHYPPEVTTVLDALSQRLRNSHELSWILEDDRVRIVARGEAIRHWNSWWAAERAKEPRPARNR